MSICTFVFHLQFICIFNAFSNEIETKGLRYRQVVKKYKMIFWY